MLGSIESSVQWHWIAYGKHPVAGDFFSLGQKAGILRAFSAWMEKGYEILASKHSSPSSLLSWRFWAKGSGKEGLVCGLVKDSADTVGRPYPLLVVGTGPLKGWEGQWDLLPFACERSWNQIEKLSIRRFQDLQQLEEEIYKIRAPSPQWTEYHSERKNLEQPGLNSDSGVSSWEPRNFKNLEASLAEQKEIMVSLDEGSSHDQFTLSSLYHSIFKARLQVLPNAVFMGGTLETTYLAVFQRPLTSADFVKLWSPAQGQ